MSTRNFRLQKLRFRPRHFIVSVYLGVCTQPKRTRSPSKIRSSKTDAGQQQQQQQEQHCDSDAARFPPLHNRGAVASSTECKAATVIPIARTDPPNSFAASASLRWLLDGNSERGAGPRAVVGTGLTSTDRSVRSVARGMKSNLARRD
jgi:hypothetical protein